MARLAQNQDEIEALSLRLDAARNDLGLAAITLRQRLDIPKRISGSVRQHPTRWFGASLAAGLLASLGLRRRRKRPRRVAATRNRQNSRRLLAGAASVLFTILRPMIQKWLLQLLQRRC